MQRRHFLSKTIAALAATGFSTQVYSQNQKPSTAFKVANHKSRYKESISIAHAPIDFKLLSTDSQNRLSIFISNNLLKGYGPPLHVHHSFDEFFCIIEGSFLFQAGDNMIAMEKGDTLFIPRNIKHAFNYTGATSGSLLVAILPGTGMETYFAEMGKLVSSKGMPDMQALDALYKKYDSAILGPPMK